MIAALLLAGCLSPRGRPVPPLIEPPPGGVDTSTTVTTGGPEARGYVAPSVRVRNDDGLQIGGFVALLPAHGGNPGTILVTGVWDAVEGPYTTESTRLVLPVLPSGEYDASEVWDGVSQISESWPYHAVVNAGDVDRDGHLDLWFGERLIRGPLFGRNITYATEPFLASLDGEFAVAGDFDADGDGEIDVIAQHPVGSQAFVRYGPLTGAIPSASEGQADPATYSSLGESAGCDLTVRAEWLRDHLGPGHDAVTVGVDLELCSNDTFVWDPFVPRGTHRTYEEALAVLTHFATQLGDVAVHDVGDADLDGHPDVIYEYQSGAELLPGPLQGMYATNTERDLPYDTTTGIPGRSMGDVNGDGAPEILGKWSWISPAKTEFTTWVLMCSPFTFPLDFSTGVPLIEPHGGPFVMSSFIGNDSVDLDGDGLHDLVETVVDNEDPTEGGLLIWYGKDLGAACAANH